MNDKTFTQDEMQKIVEISLGRNRLILALAHAIQRGRMEGDPQELLAPLINEYNALVRPQNPEPQKEPDTQDGQSDESE